MSGRTQAASHLRQRGLSAKKRYGQNFLTDAGVCRRIAEAALPEGGSVLEIGPGLGALTVELAARAAHVVAVDLDPDMIAVLRDDLAPALGSDKLTLLHADGVTADWLALLAPHPTPHVVCGNLPYLVTGRFLEHAIQVARAVDRVVFMVQLEVAERLAAAPGTKAYGALTVFTRAAFDVTRVMTVKAGAFHPRPEVDSAVVALTPRAAALAETPTFRALVRAGFGTRRKTLRNTWRTLDRLWPVIESTATERGLDLGLRAEALEPDALHAFASAVDARLDVEKTPGEGRAV